MHHTHPQRMDGKLGVLDFLDLLVHLGSSEWPEMESLDAVHKILEVAS